MLLRGGSTGTACECRGGGAGAGITVTPASCMVPGSHARECMLGCSGGVGSGGVVWVHALVEVG